MLISQRPILTEEPISEFRSRFVLEPLEPGFGYTLGNSLRRTLLSSIPGASVTSIRIDGVLHEFSTIDGIKEDVTEIILNLKGLVLSSEIDEPVVMYLRKQGPGSVTAADIQPPAGVEVHNPELHLATLNDKGKLEIELVVERGRGYVPSTMNKHPEQEIGRIPVDSIYSPVLKVSYKVEATRVEQRTDYEKLILQIECDGSITPKDALQESAKILIQHFMLFSDERISLELEERVEVEEFDESSLHMRQLLKTKLSDMDLSVRALNCLKAADIETLGELVSYNKNDLLKFRNFGKKSLTELEDLVENKNLTFGMDVSKYKLDKE